MESLTEVVQAIADFGWELVAFVAMALGLLFTVLFKFTQIRRAPEMVRLITKGAAGQDGGISSFQALSMTLASRVGVGAIAGVATAIAAGGPGAIFWMWVSGFFGMCTKYAEIVLSIHYREKGEDGTFVGGPAWYMKKGLNSRFLAICFTIGLALACIGGNMVQSNTIAETVKEMFNVSPVLIGIFMVILVAIVSIGGVKNLGRVAEVMVPFMSALYIIGGLIVLCVNFTAIPETFRLIFVSAFTPTSVGGGIAGFAVMEAIRYGISRGLYSNEAGQGTAPIAHATAKTDHPVRQGLWGITEVFINTFLICTMTALTILTTGVMTADSSPATLTSVAFGSVLPAMQYVVSISLILFAYSTIIGLSFYGETLARYIGGVKLGLVYRYLFLPFTFIGAIGGLKTVWGVVDVLIGVAVIPNLIALLLLSPIVFKLTNQFFADPAKLSAQPEKNR